MERHWSDKRTYEDAPMYGRVMDYTLPSVWAAGYNAAVAECIRQLEVSVATEKVMNVLPHRWPNEVWYSWWDYHRDTIDQYRRVADKALRRGDTALARRAARAYRERMDRIYPNLHWKEEALDRHH